MKKLRLGNGAATNSILLTLVHVVTTVLGLIITKLLSVNFSLQEYGTYSQALLVTTTATSFSILGLTNGINYFYNRTQDPEKQKSYTATIFTIQYFVGTLSAIIIVVFRGLIAQYFDNPDLKNILFIVACTPAFTNLINMYQNLFVSIGQAKKIAVRNFVVSTCRLIAVLIACFVTESALTGLYVILSVILGLDILQVLYFALVFAKEKGAIKPKNTDPKLIKEILAFCLPMAVYALTYSLTRDIDKYVVSAFSNTETLAIYTNASKILPFDLLTTSLITVLVPIITRYINQKNYLEAKNIFKLYLRIGYILTCIFVGGAIAVANHLMPFLYDEKYISGLPVFIVYLFIDMIRFANVTTVLSGAGKSKILMYTSISVLVLNGIFNVLTYKLFGMIGPALTTLVLTILMSITLLHFGAKEIKCRIRELFDFKEVALIGSEIIVFGVGTHFLSNLLRNTLHLPLFFVLAISYGLYLVALFGLNFKRTIKLLKSLNTYK